MSWSVRGGIFGEPLVGIEPDDLVITSPTGGAPDARFHAPDLRFHTPTDKFVHGCGDASGGTPGHAIWS